MLQFPLTQLPHSRSMPFAIFTGLRRCCSSSSTSTFRTTILSSMPALPLPIYSSKRG
ncbi:hypothetical protein LguiA_030464 [Lonicera macranthoides]